MSFVGVAVTRVRKIDVVTYLFGETKPTILRPRLNSYTMLDAAYVSGIMAAEQTHDLYENELLKETTFVIR